MPGLAAVDGAVLLALTEPGLDERIREIYQELQALWPEKFEVVEGPYNLEFVTSVTHSIENRQSRDVVLLDNDLIVPIDWLRSLQSEAYSKPCIATIAHFSQNSSSSIFFEFLYETSQFIGLDDSSLESNFSRPDYSDFERNNHLCSCVYIRCTDISRFIEEPPMTRLLPIAKAIYHRLPLTQVAKWRLRAWLQPLLTNLSANQESGSTLRAIGSALRPGKEGGPDGLDFDLERALSEILEYIGAHALHYGPPRLWIALPFLATGGAEFAALHLCKAARELRPDQSVVLLLTDKNSVSDRMSLPDGVLLVVLDQFLSEPFSYERKQVLLRNLLRAAEPHTFHNINSEVAWHLILSDGEFLNRYSRLYASIFAFQYTPDRRNKIGYAAYFLKRGIPHLAGLLSDNLRFLTDASQEYALSAEEAARLSVLYQPCRLLLDVRAEAAAKLIDANRNRLISNVIPVSDRRPQVLWAGRLDAEKRIDLFLEVVRRCQFADFRVFGQVVVNDQASLPELANLSYEGPFNSPLEWIERYYFDAFIFTSRWEGMPNVLLEVGALGIPLIAPTVGGVIELVDESTGYPLPEQPDPRDYEAALLEIISRPDQARDRAYRLRELISRRHSWSNFVAEVAALPGYLPPLTSFASAANELSRSEDPVVSVVVPCYNQGRYLEQAVTSALSACSRRMEIIIVDDGSTDPRIAKQLAQARQFNPDVVRIHRQRNQGLSGARNTGMALLRGQYVQFLDADDLLTPGKIDAQVAQLELNPELDISVCNYLLCDESRGFFTKTEEAIARFEMSERDFLYRWERGFVIPIHAGLFRKAALTENLFDTQVKAKEDWLFWTRLSIAGKRFGYIAGHWAIYRQHESSMRRSYVNMGTAWLQAGLKINEAVGHREPLFFESVVSWFEQCYRSNPDYRSEIARRQLALSTSAAALVTPEKVQNSALQASQFARDILDALSPLKPSSQDPKISVVVPVYGHFEYLKSCLGSLADQGAVPFEIICIDDGSPDARVALLLGELRDRNPRLRVHREPANLGISVIQNLAVEMARGEYVAFLDCDDSLAQGALEAVHTTLVSNPEVDYLFTDRIDVDDEGEIIRIARYGGYDRILFKSNESIPDDLLDGMVASHLKVIRRKVYQAVGGCDPTLSGVQDWDLALRIAQNYRLYYLAEPLYRHRIHQKSVTRIDNVAQIRKTNVILRKHLEAWQLQSTHNQLIHEFGPADLPIPLTHLKMLWRRGDRCVADFTGNVNIGQINFLREFNAYFDRIVWNDPKVPSALFGYLHDRLQMIRSR